MLTVAYLLMAAVVGFLSGATTDARLPSYARWMLGVALVLQAAATILVLLGSGAV